MVNSRSSLRSIYADHNGKVSDKWAIYIDEYERVLEKHRDQAVNLLEIGIQNGGSLEIWDKFFPNANTIIGCDVNPVCAKLTFESSKIEVVVGDANSQDVRNRIASLAPTLDVIIDDGSHQSGDIISSFFCYFKNLSDGGIYIVEDLHCSYWEDFDGGIFQPYSSISFFKKLADTVNHEHWGIKRSRQDFISGFNKEKYVELDDATLAHIHSITFVNSICIIKKALPSENALGERVVAGTVALVDERPLSQRGHTVNCSDQSLNPWSCIDGVAGTDISAKQDETDELQAIGGEPKNTKLLEIMAKKIDSELLSLHKFRQEVEALLRETVKRELSLSERLARIRDDRERVSTDPANKKH